MEKTRTASDLTCKAVGKSKKLCRQICLSRVYLTIHRIFIRPTKFQQLINRGKIEYSVSDSIIYWLVIIFRSVNSSIGARIISLWSLEGQGKKQNQFVVCWSQSSHFQSMNAWGKGTLHPMTMALNQFLHLPSVNVLDQIILLESLSWIERSLILYDKSSIRLPYVKFA